MIYSILLEKLIILINVQQDAIYSVYYISVGRAAYRNVINWISRILLDSY